jgi:hypothetical protein
LPSALAPRSIRVATSSSWHSNRRAPPWTPLRLPRQPW